MPRSSSIWLMLPPECVAASMPTSTAESAPTASLPQASTNSSTDMFAVCAHVLTEPAFVATALSMLDMMVEMAVPPASASMPMDDSAVARPSTSASDSLIDFPAPAMRMAMCEMSASVVAKLLPRATMVEPKLRVLPCDMSMMLANWASSVAASSALMLVAMSRPLTTSPNSCRSSML